MTIVLEPSNNAGGVRDKVAQAAPVEHNQPLLPRPGVAQAPSPSSTASAAALARLLLAGGRAADALACVEAALSAAPRSTELLHLRGGCLLAAGNVPGEQSNAAGRRHSCGCLHLLLRHGAATAAGPCSVALRRDRSNQRRPRPAANQR
jgi:hypothetical protein